MLNQEQVVKLWTDALESGQYEQCGGVLERDGKYCCLGILCHLFCENVKDIRKETELGTIQYAGDRLALPLEVMEWAGLTHKEGMFKDENDRANLLSGLNDGGQSFNTIAKVIKSKPKGLFVEGSENNE